MRKSYHLRSQLMPYIYTLAYRAYEEGIPMIEPMYYEYPTDEESYRHEGQYFFGDAFLVAPITSPMENGAATKDVWVKEGVWYDFFTGKCYEKGIHTFSCPLEEFPLLMRGGTPIPMQAYTNRMTKKAPDTLIVTCFPGEGGAFTLYEDDGISRGFEKGAYLKTRISYKNEHGKITLEIMPEGNGYEGMPERRAYRIDLMNMEKPMRLIDGEGEITFGEGKITVAIPEKAAKKQIRLVLE